MTKIDHVPFEKEDYERLHRVLDDEASILGDYSKKDLHNIIHKKGIKEKNIRQMACQALHQKLPKN